MKIITYITKTKIPCECNLCKENYTRIWNIKIEKNNQVLNICEKCLFLAFVKLKKT